MKKEYQIRVEWEQDGEEEIHLVPSLKAAKKEWASLIERIRASEPTDDVHVELVEVLQQERIEPETNGSDDL